MLLTRAQSAFRSFGLFQQLPQKRFMSGLTHHKPNNFEKFLLVHFKRYPRGQVPDLVPQDQMEKVRNMARIKLNIYMCIATFFGALGAIWMGKRDRHQGISLQQINIDWHDELRAQAAKEKLEKENRGS